MKCPHCQKRIKINPASLLAQRMSPARLAANIANGAKGGRPRKQPEGKANR